MASSGRIPCACFEKRRQNWKKLLTSLENVKVMGIDITYSRMNLPLMRLNLQLLEQ